MSTVTAPASTMFPRRILNIARICGGHSYTNDLYIEVTENDIIFVGTDGKAMIRVTLPNSDKLPASMALFIAGDIKDVLKGKDDVKLTHDGTNLALSVPVMKGKSTVTINPNLHGNASPHQQHASFMEPYKGEYAPTIYANLSVLAPMLAIMEDIADSGDGEPLGFTIEPAPAKVSTPATVEFNRAGLNIRAVYMRVNKTT